MMAADYGSFLLWSLVGAEFGRSLSGSRPDSDSVNVKWMLFESVIVESLHESVPRATTRVKQY